MTKDNESAQDYRHQEDCTSCTSLLFILLFIKSQYTVFAHLICFALFILLHILLFISLFLPIYMLLCCVTFISFLFDSVALSTERTWFYYISLQIKSNQITFIVTSPQHKCLGEWNSYERAPDSAKNNNLHMDSTYLQTVQKTMCKIHIHILSTHSVL